MKKFISLLILVFQFDLCFTQSWMIMARLVSQQTIFVLAPIFMKMK